LIEDCAPLLEETKRASINVADINANTGNFSFISVLFILNLVFKFRNLIAVQIDIITT